MSFKKDPIKKGKELLEIWIGKKNTEVAKKIKEIKRKEQVDMDEISNLLYNNPKNREKRS